MNFCIIGQQVFTENVFFFYDLDRYKLFPTNKIAVKNQRPMSLQVEKFMDEGDTYSS